MKAPRAIVLLCLAALCLGRPVAAQEPEILVRGDSVLIHMVNVELRLAVQMLATYLDRPVIHGALGGTLITLTTPVPVPRAQVLALLRSTLESQAHELRDDSVAGVWRIQPPAPAAEGRPAATRRTGGLPELFVIRLSHARAGDVAATINALYGRPGALGERAAGPETLPQQLRQNLAQPELGPNQAAGAAGRVASLEGDVSIVPDPGTNSLLIRASRDDFDLINAAVVELDIRPLQVLIEVTIAELRTDRSWGFGVTTEQGPRPIGGRGATIEGAVEGMGLGDLVLRVMQIGGSTLQATLRASAARGDARILSRPVVLAANNELATITVGSQRPFVQISRSLPTESPQRDQVVQYKDVGTSLTVRPTISASGYVTLEVTQEVNAATAETAFDAPVISTRSVKTQLLVRDSQTVIIGGLSDVQREVSRGGVPILSSIPLLGGLFGRHQRRASSTELFIFLTPRILKSDEDVAEVTAPRVGMIPPAGEKPAVKEEPPSKRE